MEKRKEEAEEAGGGGGGGENRLSELHVHALQM
jgi:hypothetical protein